MVTWVDSQDTAWIKEKNKYLGLEKNPTKQYTDSRRYREEVSFKYWFRSIAENCPWVHKIYLVTNGQIPDWLNVENPKLSIVPHQDILSPDALPTFNSNAIETGIARIEGLSENFVLFNDDMYVIHQTREDFFFKDNVPRDEFILYPSIPRDDFDHIMANNLILINNSPEIKDFKKRNISKLFSLKYGVKLIWQFFAMLLPAISGFRNPHIPISYNKSQFLEVEQRFKLSFKQTEFHRFRDNKDISHWVVRYIRLLRGEFETRSPKEAEYLSISEGVVGALNRVFKKERIKLLCLNDDDLDVSSTTLRDVNSFFEKEFPQKSSFEV